MHAVGTVSVVTPAFTAWDGNTTITITGSGLGNGSDITAVKIHNIDVTDIQEQTATSVIVTTPQGPSSGAVDIVVMSVSTGNASLASALTYRTSTFDCN